MLTALSVRDIVLIEKLDLALGGGLTVLTGETGAGKSILLDALGLALGARGDSSLVRSGQKRGVVTAALQLPTDHPVMALLDEQGIDCDGEIVIRRIQTADGPSRAFLNDQPVSVSLLRRMATYLAEIHGQHDDRALVDPEQHRKLVDAFGGLEAKVEALSGLWRDWRAALKLLSEREADIEKAKAEQEYIAHSVEELRRFDAKAGEEDELATQRQMMMHAEQFSEAIGEARSALVNDGTLDARLNAALRKLERRREEAAGLLDEVCSSLDKLLIDMNEVYQALSRAEDGFRFDTADLERTEERLFALRTLARKHKVAADDLPELLQRYENALQSIEDGGKSVDEARKAADAAGKAYMAAAHSLSSERTEVASRLDQAVVAELAPLKLGQATFHTLVEPDEARASASGIDHVEFTVSANPGVPPGPLSKTASGGELSRIMLALKVTLAEKASAPTLVFDEIDTGVGGAVADAMGQRLARLADGLQVLAVTHSPQVAARADDHLLIAKMQDVSGDDSARVVTQVTQLQPDSRREEIARMLSAAEVTNEARAQADRLLDQTG